MTAFCHHCGVKLPGDSRFCLECGAAISVEDPLSGVQGAAPSAPVPTVEPLHDIAQAAVLKSRQREVLHPTQDNRGRRKLAIFVIVVALIIAIAVLVHAPRTGTTVLPPSEANFINVVATAQRDSAQAENDMQKGGIKARRDKSICDAMTSLQVQNWIGTVQTIDSNSDGKGVLAISIAPDVLVTTWNNEFSDIETHTLIEPGSPVFESASAMKHGQLVAFSGTFFRGSEGDCLREGSLRLDGKLKSPEFIFLFSEVSAYYPHSEPAPAPQEPKPAPMEDSKPTAPVNRGDAASTSTSRVPLFSQARSYSEACDAGFGDGCNNLGSLYDKGIGVAKDYSRAVALYSKACGSGFTDGCGNLGNMYADGHGVAQDVSRAVVLWTKACDAGGAAGCANLGTIYAEGNGVKQDFSRSVVFFSKACDAADAIGCRNLGRLYGAGNGVAQDYSRAAGLYSKACEGGDEEGCSILGAYYYIGRGVSRDIEKGRQFLSKGCSMGDQQACDQLKHIQ